MVASGYKIVHLLFQYRRFIKNAVIILFMLLTSLLMSYSNFFLTILMVSEIVILILLLKMDISYTIRSLQEMIQGLDVNSPQDHDYVKGILFKIKYYKVFMFYVYVYWPMEIIAQSLRPFLALYHQWIFTLLHQILTLISLSFLFITLHFSIKERPNNLDDPCAKIPLPFDPDRDPKITGEIIIIHSVGDRPEGVFSVGVECSYKHRISAVKTQQVFNDRAKVYQVDDIEEEAKHDIWKITQNLNIWDSETSLAHNFKMKLTRPEHSTMNENKPTENSSPEIESDIEEFGQHDKLPSIKSRRLSNHVFSASKFCNDDLFNPQPETRNEPIWFKYG